MEPLKPASRVPRPLAALLALCLAAGAVALARTTAHNGWDFDVFWRAGRALLDGQPVYSTARDGAMAFKYPPWIAPFFAPLALLPIEWARWAWGSIEVASLAAVARWVSARLGCAPVAWIPALIAFWGLWMVHALDGQISLVMLALALWRWSPGALEKFGSRSVALVLALSTKIFTLFPLVSFQPTRRRALAIAKVAALCLALSFPAWRADPGGTPLSLVRSWADAAGSAGSLFDPGKTRGRNNPGLPGFALGLAGAPEGSLSHDLLATCAFALLLGLAWRRLSRGLDPAEAWVGWLGLAPVIHPLPWWHLFVFAFPLCAAALDRSIRREDRAGVALAVIGVFLVGMATEKLLGRPGFHLERMAAKSWGVLLCAWALARAGARSAREAAS